MTCFSFAQIWFQLRPLGVKNGYFINSNELFLLQNTQAGTFWAEQEDGTYQEKKFFNSILSSPDWIKAKATINNFLDEKPGTYELVRKASSLKLVIHVLKDSLSAFMKYECYATKYHTTLIEICEYFAEVYAALHDNAELESLVVWVCEHKDRFSYVTADSLFQEYKKIVQDRAEAFQIKEDVALLGIMKEIESQNVAFLLRCWIINQLCRSRIMCFHKQ